VTGGCGQEGIMAAITSTILETEDAVVSVEEYVDRFVEWRRKADLRVREWRAFPKVNRNQKAQQDPAEHPILHSPEIRRGF
jgi:hypothetical protein